MDQNTQSTQKEMYWRGLEPNPQKNISQIRDVSGAPGGGSSGSSFGGTTRATKENMLPSPFQDPDEELSMMPGEYARIQNSISEQIQKITDAPIEVDGAALVGSIKEAFEATKDRLVQSALAEVEQAGMQMDAYFGGQTGDQRSGARRRMASEATNKMLKSAFQSVAQLHSAQVDKVVGTELEAAKINIQAADVKARAIGDFVGKGVSTFGTMLDAVNSNWIARLRASVEWGQIESSNVAHDLNAAVALLTSKEYGIKGALQHSLPTVANPTILAQARRMATTTDWSGGEGRGDLSRSLVGGDVVDQRRAYEIYDKYRRSQGMTIEQARSMATKPSQSSIDWA
jgi:hypothetical protein